jgi:hypothetical protein
MIQGFESGGDGVSARMLAGCHPTGPPGGAHIRAELGRTGTRLWFWRAEGVAVIVAGLLVLTRAVQHQPFALLSAWLPSILAVSAPVVYLVGAHVLFHLRAPKRLYEASQAALGDSEIALATSKRDHAEEVAAIRQEKATALAEGAVRYSEMESKYKAARSLVTTRIVEAGKRLLLLVENKGSVATCLSARLHIEGELSEQLPADAYCRWNGAASNWRGWGSRTLRRMARRPIRRRP